MRYFLRGMKLRVLYLQIHAYHMFVYVLECILKNGVRSTSESVDLVSSILMGTRGSGTGKNPADPVSAVLAILCTKLLD